MTVQQAHARNRAPAGKQRAPVWTHTLWRACAALLLLGAASAVGAQPTAPVWIHVRLMHKAVYHSELSAPEICASHHDEATLYVQQRYIGHWNPKPAPEDNIFDDLQLLQSSGQFRSAGQRTLGPFKGWSDYGTSWNTTKAEDESTFDFVRPRFGEPWKVSFHLTRAVVGSEQTANDMAPMRHMLRRTDFGELRADVQFSFNPPLQPAAPTGKADLDAILKQLYTGFKAGAEQPFVIADRPIYWTLVTKQTAGHAVARLKQTVNIPMNGANGHWTVSTHLVIWTSPVNGGGQPDDLPPVGP
jgi:hypothetical protein